MNLLKIIERLENDIKELQQQIGILYYHKEKTEIWCEYIGHWKTNVISVDMSISDGLNSDPVPHFVIQVKLFDKVEVDNRENIPILSNYGEGWIIIRTLKEFQRLHQSLICIKQQLAEKFRRIPNINRNLITKTFDENKLNQIKSILDDYLQVPLK